MAGPPGWSAHGDTGLCRPRPLRPPQRRQSSKCSADASEGHGLRPKHRHHGIPVLPGCAPPAHGPPECTRCPTQPLLAVTGQRDLPRPLGKADLPPHSPAPLHFLLVVLAAATTSHVHAPSVPRASVSITHATAHRGAEPHHDPAGCGARCEPAMCTHTAQQSFPPRVPDPTFPIFPGCF